jgi:hypothetical protein
MTSHVTKGVGQVSEELILSGVREAVLWRWPSNMLATERTERRDFIYPWSFQDLSQISQAGNVLVAPRASQWPMYEDIFMEFGPENS